VPGTEYAWHEVSVGLALAGHHKLVHDKVLAAVNAVHAEDRIVESLVSDLNRESPPVPLAINKRQLPTLNTFCEGIVFFAVGAGETG
jgi:hypothetical protein